MPTLTAHDLRRLTREVFLRMGVDDGGAGWMATVLVRANLQGHDSHGVMRIPQYFEGWRRGEVDSQARPVVTVVGPGTALVDGRRGLGQLVAREAMLRCIELARSSGVAAVGVHNCYHVGRLCDYTEMALAQDMVAFACANGSGGGQWVAPWRGRAPRLSTNPIAFACPGDPPLSLDISTAMAPEGVIRLKRARRERVPPGWLIDANGAPTTDPEALYVQPPGALLPFGGHKGYGLAVMVEILAGVLSGAGFSQPDVRAVGNGLFLLAVEIARFVPPAQFHASVDALVRYLKSSPVAPGFGEVLVPGEPEAEAERQGLTEGIHLADETWEQIAAVTRELGVQL